MRRSPPLVKITRPVAAGIVPRERLFSLLDRRRSRPVIWITGPPGSGKTTLLSSYVESRKLPCIWYQVDTRDSEAATFFYYMRLAAKNVLSRKRIFLPLLTPEYQASLPIFARQYFEELFRRLTIPYMIVLDNYQEVTSNSPFHMAIREGLSTIPQGINVIIMSRDTVHRELLRLKVNERMSIIHWEDLRLTLKEAKSVARLRGRLPERIVKGLHRKSQGWIAGFVLLLEALKKGEMDYREIENFSSRELFDYFACEVFNRMDKDVKDFLLKTSVLPIVTESMAKEITGEERVKEILSILHERSYFVIKQPGKRDAYQYHPLFPMYPHHP